jgi:hypothetical protein
LRTDFNAYEDLCPPWLLDRIPVPGDTNPTLLGKLLLKTSFDRLNESNGHDNYVYTFATSISQLDQPSGEPPLDFYGAAESVLLASSVTQNIDPTLLPGQGQSLIVGLTNLPYNATGSNGDGTVSLQSQKRIGGPLVTGSTAWQQGVFPGLRHSPLPSEFPIPSTWVTSLNANQLESPLFTQFIWDALDHHYFSGLLLTPIDRLRFRSIGLN